jgi:DNA-binding MarR family transcriptional regulator
VATRLHSAAIHLLRQLRVEDVATGISGPRLSALSVIAIRGPISLGDLARAEQVRAPTMSRLVAALGRAGLIESERDPSDRRVQRIQATPRGRALFEVGRGRRIRRLTRELDRLTAEEFATLLAALPSLERVAHPASKAP